MSMLHIGAGGWSYFQVPGIDPLTAYSKAFDYVEVNSTFYTIPSLRAVRSWRERMPDNFVFSVRCHKDLTHKYLLSPCRESCDILARSFRICGELRAQILLIQTPPSFDPDEKIKDIRDLFSSFRPGGIRLAWEIRGRLTERTIGLMRDLEIIHSTDILREMPAFDSDVLYTRLFGHGIHNLYQFDDAELMLIDKRIKKKYPKEAYFTFHGAKMYTDAARMLVYQKTGTFPGVTKTTGFASLACVLEEDAKFPATKKELIAKQGWKVYDLSANRHVHASQALERLPEGSYANVNEVIEALKRSNL